MQKINLRFQFFRNKLVKVVVSLVGQITGIEVNDCPYKGFRAIGVVNGKGLITTTVPLVYKQAIGYLVSPSLIWLLPVPIAVVFTI
jgi:hypothetical protein